MTKEQISRLIRQHADMLQESNSDIDATLLFAAGTVCELPYPRVYKSLQTAKRRLEEQSRRCANLAFELQAYTNELSVRRDLND